MERRRKGALVIALATAAVLGAVFGWLTDLVSAGGSDRVDLLAERWVIAHRADWATSALRIVTNLGSSLVLWPLVGIGAILLLWRGQHWSSAILLAASLVGVLLAKDIVKPLIERPRPPGGWWLVDASGSAYPSGHASQALAVFGALAFLVSVDRSRGVQVAVWGGASLVSLVVGWSRLYLGVHWLTDVLGGFAVAGSWVALLAGLWLAIRPRAGPARNEPYRPAHGP